MKQFYFFKLVEENNGTQWRKYAYPLPGQTTYLTLRDRNHVIDHNCRAQLDREENTKFVQLFAGDVVGICHEGDNARDCRLLEYNNHGTIFYKATGEIFLIGDANPYIEGLRCASECDGMNDAFLRLVQQNGTVGQPAAPGASATATPHTDAADDAQDGSVSGTGDVTMPVYSRVEMRELDAIEQSLLNTLTNRQANEKLLVISQIRDRMRTGVARFVYIKQNGDTRVAYGTRCGSVVELLGGNTSGMPRREGDSDGVHFHYFDIQRRDWRCFCTEDVQSVSIDYYVNLAERDQIISLAGAA